ncbi:Anamorsin [Cinara cedri]|uniref:Anamorsin homolog n=1 Tax=Cinara cedri TaxID=506608 RepID=A0A5E4M972_9HEMI|nr:Anamorsin [Cinara cedri]
MDNPHVTYLTNLLAREPENADKSKKNILVVIDRYEKNGPIWKSLGGEYLDEVVGLYADRGHIEFSQVPSPDKKTEKLYNAILSGVIGSEVSCELDLLSTYTQLLIPGGRLIVKTTADNEGQWIKRLKMCGFQIDTPAMEGIIIGSTPSYKVGSSDKVTFNESNVLAAWNLQDQNAETIAEDDLLEADDLKKPISSSLRVCATTKKAKACKDCSCGLAEELDAMRSKSETSETSKPLPDTSNAKSSCGSCYLGDAFRCASCPYLGMPAFKPGEKVQLAGNLLQDDF